MRADCIVQCFKFSVKCPNCSTPYATMIGSMPKGTMSVTRYPVGAAPLSGHASSGTLVIRYHFPDGTQGDEHPNPGVAYEGTSRIAYLPDTPEGNEVMQLLVRAFENRQSFAVRCRSARRRCPVWLCLPRHARV